MNTKVAEEIKSAPMSPGLSKPFEEVLSDFVATSLVVNDWRIFVNDKPMPANLLAGNNMLLPAILWQAEKTHLLLHGKPLGVKFRSDPDAAVGAQAVIENAPGGARALYPLFCMEVICRSLEDFTLEGPDTEILASEVRENTLMGRHLPPRGTSCSVDHLITSFFQDHELGMLQWVGTPSSPNIG